MTAAPHHTGTLEVLTPTYRPDLPLCDDLRASVLAHAGSGVTHRVIVPARDIHLVERWREGRVELEQSSQYLPRWLLRVPGNLHVDPRRPWWPVRGWITQQLVKLEATARSEADLTVVADSDLVFVRQFDADTFRTDGAPQFYALHGGVHDGMPRHLAWHRVSRWLLGLDPNVAPPLPDYICWPCVWEPMVVRSMLSHIEEQHHRPWQQLIAQCRHFSEMILYGVYVEEVLGSDKARRTVDRMRCSRHSDESPLNRAALRNLVDRRSPDDVAVMISARSGTSLGERRAALASAIKST